MLTRLLKTTNSKQLNFVMSKITSKKFKTNLVKLTKLIWLKLAPRPGLLLALNNKKNLLLKLKLNLLLRKLISLRKKFTLVTNVTNKFVASL